MYDRSLYCHFKFVNGKTEVLKVRDLFLFLYLNKVIYKDQKMFLNCQITQVIKYVKR